MWLDSCLHSCMIILVMLWIENPFVAANDGTRCSLIYAEDVKVQCGSYSDLGQASCWVMPGWQEARATWEYGTHALRARLWKAPQASFTMSEAPSTFLAWRSTFIEKSPHGSPHVHTWSPSMRHVSSVLLLLRCGYVTLIQFLEDVGCTGFQLALL